MMAVPQCSGKTTSVVLSAIEHAIHHRQINPMYIAANADLANTVWQQKIRRSLEANQKLKSLIFVNDDEGGNRLQRNFTNGTCLYVAGSESVGNLSAKTSPVVIFDDVQASGTIPGFGHPADYAATRTGAYPLDEVTLAYLGTAGRFEDWLYVALSASAYYLPFVPCLACGTYQLVEFSRFQFSHDSVESAKVDTWMSCANPECSHHITFTELPEMLSRHVWVSTPSGVDWVMEPMPGGTRVDLKTADIYPETARNTNVAGFWSNAFYWPFGRTWGEWAVEWITRQSENDATEKMKDWGQNVEGRPYKEPEIDEEKLQEAEIGTHCEGTGYAAKTIPAAADLVFVTVDTQSGYIYWLVRAWQRATGSSWLVDMGTFGKRIMGKSDLAIGERRRTLISGALSECDAMCRRGWDVVSADGSVVGHREIDIGAIDRGFEPDIVAFWWQNSHRTKWLLIKGLPAGSKGSMWPAKPAIDKRGRPYRDVDVNQAKHLLRSLLRIPYGENGFQALPSTGLHANTMRAYARHMTSERFDRTAKNPKFETIKPGTRNHLWDCETYGVCLAVACGVRMPSLEGSPNPATTNSYPVRESSGNSERKGSWKIGR
jgi:phage terminase large subunit GpA-like protein